MEKLEQTLLDWKQSPQQMIEIDKINLDPALQPRDGRLVPYKEQRQVEVAAADHIARMHAALDGGKDRQLEPLLVASYDGGLHLVDGHHRRKAYQRAGRQTVPVRILSTDKRQAVFLSKLVNVGDVKMAMCKEQARDACWQFIALITHQGRHMAGVQEAGMSERKLAALFGVARGTVAAMLKRVETVKLAEFGPAALDPGTGWPRWIDVKGNACRDSFAEMDIDAKTQWRAGKLAKALGTLLSDYPDMQVWKLARQLLMQDAADSAGEDVLTDLAKWSEWNQQVTY